MLAEAYPSKPTNHYIKIAKGVGKASYVGKAKAAPNAIYRFNRRKVRPTRVVEAESSTSQFNICTIYVL